MTNRLYERVTKMLDRSSPNRERSVERERNLWADEVALIVGQQPRPVYDQKDGERYVVELQQLEDYGVQLFKRMDREHAFAMHAYLVMHNASDEQYMYTNAGHSLRFKGSSLEDFARDFGIKSLAYLLEAA